MTKRFTKLSKELLFAFLLDLGISAFAFFFINLIADGILISYCDNHNIIMTEMQEITYLTWISAVSFSASTGIFIILFLILVGQKLAYLKDITGGIQALTAHRLNYEIPVKYNNEFSQLAAAINQMSKTELELKEKEEKLKEDRENFIRAMSHDIRTPLTAIISHTEYLKSKDDISTADLEEYLNMTSKKAVQIKELTDMLLDSATATKEFIPDGRLLFIQLADEWMASLENDFDCSLSVDDNLCFSGEYRIQDFQRIFDNLSSNIEKYADPAKKVLLNIAVNEGRLIIEQANYKIPNPLPSESHKIGLESIRRIAKHYGGDIIVSETEELFKIFILLFPL